MFRLVVVKVFLVDDNCLKIEKINKNCLYNISVFNFNNILIELYVNILNIILYIVGYKIERGRKVDNFL